MLCILYQFEQVLAAEWIIFYVFFIEMKYILYRRKDTGTINNPSEYSLYITQKVCSRVYPFVKKKRSKQTLFDPKFSFSIFWETVQGTPATFDETNNIPEE